MSKGGAWHGEAVGKWELNWRKAEGFYENGIPPVLLTLLSPVDFPTPAAPFLGWHLRLFAWSLDPVQPRGKQVYNDLREEKKQVSQDVVQCQLWAWVGGKRPLWQTRSLGARPRPAWADSPLPRTSPDKHGSEERGLPPFERDPGPEGGQGAGEREEGEDWVLALWGLK